MNTSTAINRQGLFFGILSYVLWGIAPVYFKLLDHVPAIEILGHRIIWSIMVIALLMLITQRWSAVLAILRQPIKLLWLLLSGALIGANWLSYINAINSGDVLSASLGYYITPLVLIFFGVIFLREKLTPWKVIAISLAGIGVTTQIIFAGVIPWIALIIAASFSFYSLVRKYIGIDSLTGLLIETLCLSPFALFFLYGMEGIQTSNIITNDWQLNLLLISTGLATTLPLFFFAEASLRLSFSTLGFLQYISPSLMWLLAVFFYHEPLNPVIFISFAFIWSGLIFYSLENILSKDKQR